MSAVAAAVVGSAVIGGVVASSAASKAAKAQTQAADTAAAEQRAARDQITALLAPYTASGIPALQAQLNLLGLGTKTTDWEAYARSNPALMRAYEAQRTQPVVGFGAVGQPVQFASGQFTQAEQVRLQMSHQFGCQVQRQQAGEFGVVGVGVGAGAVGHRVFIGGGQGCRQSGVHGVSPRTGKIGKSRILEGLVCVV